MTLCHQIIAKIPPPDRIAYENILVFSILSVPQISSVFAQQRKENLERMQQPLINANAMFFYVPKFLPCYN